MQKIKLYLIIAGVVIFISAFITAGVYHKKYLSEKAERERFENNYRVVKDSIKTITGINGLLSVRLEAESLTTKEMKRYYENLVADVADMKIQLRKVTNITAFNTETTNSIHTFFRDSLRIDSVAIQTLSYSDRWFDIDIVKTGLKASIISHSRDSLIQVVHWNRKGKFWPTRFLTKKLYFQDIKSMNPRSEIKYSKWILPIKK